MTAQSLLRTPPALAAAALLALALGGGCNKEPAQTASSQNTTVTSDGGRGGPSRIPSPGEVLFGQKGCVRCHWVAAAGGPPGKKMGPDLTKVGADPAHTPEWFADFIRNPHGHNPSTKMPKHDESKISEQDMETLVKYLSSLK